MNATDTREYLHKFATILEKADAIYVRAQKPNGSWGNMRLVDLPVQEALKHVSSWLSDHRLPVLFTDLIERNRQRVRGD